MRPQNNLTTRQGSQMQDSLLAFPACGMWLGRLSTEIGQWAQALLEKQPDIHQWQVALDDAKA
ncbi:MAG: hypothetical protein R3E42_04095 [Burkholderiaceae bacterium]